MTVKYAAVKGDNIGCPARGSKLEVIDKVSILVVAWLSIFFDKVFRERVIFLLEKRTAPSFFEVINPSLSIQLSWSHAVVQGLAVEDEMTLKWLPTQPWMVRNEIPLRKWLVDAQTDACKARLTALGNVVFPAMAWFAVNAMAHAN